MALPSVLRILEALARQPTTSFHEARVASEAAGIARGFGATIQRDALGNLYMDPPGRRRGHPIWLVAHMDHPGVEVVGRREARLLGGVDAAYLRPGVGLRLVHGDSVVHTRVARFWPRKRRILLRAGRDVDSLRRGDFGVFDLEDFLVRRGLVLARQLDDLAGCAISLAALERTCRSGRGNLRVLLTRAEEEGFVGTLGAIEEARVPRDAWIVNVEASGALPSAEIGGGPVIRVGDRRKAFDPRAESLLLAASAKLPSSKRIQRALLTGGTCEATPWSLFGWRATGLAVPLGNYHNQGPRNRLAPEVVAVSDLATAVDLLDTAARDTEAGEAWEEAARTRLRGYLRSYGHRLRRGH